jgi:hypothetical protein
MQIIIYAERHVCWLSVINYLSMLNVIMLNVIILNVIMLSVVTPSR